MNSRSENNRMDDFGLAGVWMLWIAILVAIIF